MGAAILGFLLLSPVLTLGFALIRAAVLFWPTMLFFGAVHSDVPVVINETVWRLPDFSAWQTFLIVALVGLVLPSGTNSSSND